jgi:hypothetical protein
MNEKESIEPMKLDEALKSLVESLPDDVADLATSFSGKNVKSAKAIKSKDARQTLKGVYSFEANAEVPFVRTVRFYGTAAADIQKGIQFVFVLPNGTKSKPQSLSITKNGIYAYAQVHRVIVGFEIIPKSSRRVFEITKMEVTGHPYPLLQEVGDRLSKIIAIRSDIDAYKKAVKAEVETLEKSLGDLEQRTLTLSGEYEDAKSDTAAAAGELEAVRVTLSSETSTRDKLISENRVAQSNLTQLESKIEGLNKSVGDSEVELRQLTAKRRLISDEFSSFVDEGRGQARVYGLISIVPAVMAAVALGFLLYGGWTYAKLVVATPAQAYAYFVQRLPYTAATVTIVGLLLEILRQIVKKVMQIHEDRLALARLLVIARDATYASATDLQMDEDQIFNERMKVKMHLLKAHLGIEGISEAKAAETSSGVTSTA